MVPRYLLVELLDDRGGLGGEQGRVRGVLHRLRVLQGGLDGDALAVHHDDAAHACGGKVASVTRGVVWGGRGGVRVCGFVGVGR